ncbi:MAG: extracellular solute-binding protein, partial [Planctomycetes bacterium]|nr:extracellular solute-binding protein [Planctomycetota bacterium]
GLPNRLIAEKKRPQADVFWSGDPVRAAILKAKGVSTPYRSSRAEGLPTRFSDPDGYWTGFSARARVLIYNRNLIPESSEPKSIMDLLDKRFQGKACIANPLFGTTSMHAAALFAVLGESKAKEFFEGFTANGGTILSSNGEVRRRVAAGEFAVGITDTDDANVARLEGKPIGIVYPDQDGMGTLIIPNCTVLIAGGPNPEAGRRFIDYLLEPKTERALAESDAAQMPLRPGVEVPRNVKRIGQLKSMAVDYAALGQLLDGLSKGYLKDWVDRNRR